jgi:hypothetical protein
MILGSKGRIGLLRPPGGLYGFVSMPSFYSTPVPGRIFKVNHYRGNGSLFRLMPPAISARHMDGKELPKGSSEKSRRFRGFATEGAPLPLAD